MNTADLIIMKNLVSKTKSNKPANIVVFALFALILSGFTNVYAQPADPVEEYVLDITCNSDNEGEECVVLPSDNAPVFDPTVFPHYDLKPGDEFTRKIRVTNIGEDICYFTIDNVVVKADTEVLPGIKFSDELQTELTDGSTSTGLLTFGSLFANVPLYVATIDRLSNSPANTKILDWSVLFDKNAGNEFQNARLEFDFDWAFECGEEPGTPRLFIEKTNDKIGVDQRVGEFVTYTITVTADEERPVFNVIMTDLPAGGYIYQSGSWTANSDVRGNIKGSITTEPTYSSPGKWILGDFQPGEAVTLTYLAKIDQDTQPGIYKDLAWTEGTAGEDLESARVLGNEDTGFFVGTSNIVIEDPEVRVSVETDEEITKIQEEGEVLGASTLPATGADTLLLVFVLAAGALGVSFLILSKKLYKNNLHTVKPLTMFLGIMFALVSLNHVMAANLIIRIQEPESPNNQPDLRINFVALDQYDREITVKCYLKGPGEAGFTQLGSDIVLQNGGDDDYCFIPDGEVSDDGTYEIYAEAFAGIDSSVSQTVDFYYDPRRPGKPKDFDKDPSDCKYNISFKTADDGGDTVRVEVYRSDSKEFTAGPSTMIRDISAGSNEKIEFVDDRPNCGKNYYYAVIAFDNANNQSKPLVETIEKTETEIIESSEETTGETEEALLLGEGVRVFVTEEELGAGGEGAVEEGEEEVTGEGDTGDGTEGDISGEETPEVLGTFTQRARDFLGNYWFLILLAGFATVVWYARSRNKK